MSMPPMPETNPTESDENERSQNVADRFVYDVVGGARIENSMNASSNVDCNDNIILNPNIKPSNTTLENGGLLSATDGSQSNHLSGLRVDQLCEILSREISRVREESVLQAREMQMQYEMELQALRDEFYSKNGVQNHQTELFS